MMLMRLPDPVYKSSATWKEVSLYHERRERVVITQYVPMRRFKFIHAECVSKDKTRTNLDPLFFLLS